MSLYSRAYRTAVGVPPIAWVLGGLVLPYAMLLAHSFWSVESRRIVGSWTLGNYRALVETPLFLEALWTSVRIAAAVAAAALVLAYPLAYWMSLHAKRKNLLYLLVIIPLWTGYLVRAYAWRIILGAGGGLDGMLLGRGVGEAAGMWREGPLAVTIALAHIYTPLAFLPLYASLERIPRSLLEASRDLGAGGWDTFRRVILPLSMPGGIAGGTFVFVLGLGDFLAPMLLGGPSVVMAAGVAARLLGAGHDRPLGAAVSLCMMAVVVGLLVLAGRLERRWRCS
jgi:spermidine/putrescine transport system permease protein